MDSIENLSLEEPLDFDPTPDPEYAIGLSPDKFTDEKNRISALESQVKILTELLAKKNEAQATCTPCSSDMISEIKTKVVTFERDNNELKEIKAIGSKLVEKISNLETLTMTYQTWTSKFLQMPSEIERICQPLKVLLEVTNNLKSKRQVFLLIT